MYIHIHILKYMKPTSITKLDTSCYPFPLVVGHYLFHCPKEF